MKNTFVATKNANRFLDGLQNLNNRGASEACLMVVDGEPGMGKTNITQWWAVQNGAIYLRAKTQWTPRWFLEELLKFLNIAPAHRYTERYNQAIEALASRSGNAILNNTTFGIVIDEADHIVRKREILETVRDLSDALEIPFILVGMGRIRTSLVRFPQVASRVGQYVDFKDNDEKDTANIAKALIDVDIAPNLLAFLHQVSRGRIREVLEGLKSIESFATRNKLVTVDLNAMAGQTLLNDRATGQPIKVKRG